MLPKGISTTDLSLLAYKVSSCLHSFRSNLDQIIPIYVIATSCFLKALHFLFYTLKESSKRFEQKFLSKNLLPTHHFPVTSYSRFFTYICIITVINLSLIFPYVPDKSLPFNYYKFQCTYRTQTTRAACLDCRGTFCFRFSFI